MGYCTILYKWEWGEEKSILWNRKRGKHGVNPISCFHASMAPLYWFIQSLYRPKADSFSAVYQPAHSLPFRSNEWSKPYGDPVLTTNHMDDFTQEKYQKHFESVTGIKSSKFTEKIKACCAFNRIYEKE